MSLVAQLSSQVGDRTERSNRKVATQCLANSKLLAEIAEGLKSKNAPLVGDCAEVLTLVAEQHPEWVAPYAQALSALLGHKTTRVAWAAMHALARATSSVPKTIEPLLPRLQQIIRTDSSVIVRDYATDALANYAATSGAAAERAYPLLREALTLWEGKHAAPALKGLTNAAALLPALRQQLREIAEEQTRARRPVVRKAAREALKALASLSRAE
jgi:predicted transcriptional regulator